MIEQIQKTNMTVQRQPQRRQKKKDHQSEFDEMVKHVIERDSNSQTEEQEQYEEPLPEIDSIIIKKIDIVI